MPERRTPFWLWPNLLSLDAPIVALIWLTMFARIWRVDFLPWQAYVSLGLVVWGIYIVDRIMDIKLLGTGDPRLKERHHFLSRHLLVIGGLGVFALLAGAILPFFGMPTKLVGHGFFTKEADWQIGYIVPGLIMVGAFFVMAISALQEDEIPHLRNLLAGLTFSYGTAMTAHVYSSENVWSLLFPSPSAQSMPMYCFAMLCGINISAIHFWEKSRKSPDLDVKAAHELGLTLPLAVLAGASVMLSQSKDEVGTRPFYVAILISSALLFILNRNRRRFSMEALRVLADVALIVPYPIFLALYHF